MSFFLLLNTNKYILKNVGKQLLVPIIEVFRDQQLFTHIL